MKKVPLTASDVRIHLRSFRLMFDTAIILFITAFFPLITAVTVLDHWSFFEDLHPEFFVFVVKNFDSVSMALFAASLAAALVFLLEHFKLERISADVDAMKDGLITDAILEEYHRSNWVIRAYLEMTFPDLRDEL